MVFSKLSVQEKEAFFGLLDEYFQSRPEILAHVAGEGQSAGGLAGTGIPTAAAASVVQRALAANHANTVTTTGGTAGKSNNPYLSTVPKVNVDLAPTIGRVAAASLAFQGGGGGGESATSPLPPPTLPRRSTTNASTPGLASAHGLASAFVPAPAPAPTPDSSTPGAQVDMLVTRKGSMLSAFKKTQLSGAATIPPAFSAPKNTFGPPPVRRATSDTGSAAGSDVSASVPAPAPAPVRRSVAPPPLSLSQQQRSESTEPEGEWAEVLYDYSSEDPADLEIEAGTRVLVTAKSSDDWWTGQIEGEGKEGLFPASYVKLL